MRVILAGLLSIAAACGGAPRKHAASPPAADGAAATPTEPAPQDEIVAPDGEPLNVRGPARGISPTSSPPPPPVTGKPPPEPDKDRPKKGSDDASDPCEGGEVTP